MTPLHKLRIVSLAPSATNILEAMGAAKCLVGVSKWCKDVADVGRLPVLGDCWALDAEEVADRYRGEHRGDAGAQLSLEPGDPHLEELIEVGTGDAEELQPLEQRQRLVAGLVERRQLAGGDADEKWGGLSPEGRALIEKLNRAGIMVDVSHAGRKTMLQAAEISKAPIIASHSGVKAVADSPRNLDDDQLKALAANGGVAQLVALGAYVKPLTEAQTELQEKVRKDMGLEAPAARAAMSPETQAAYENRLSPMWEIEPRANVVDFVNHIDHAVKTAGIDHVGIASDFDGGGGIVGWQDASETLNVTRELVKRGYSEEAIAKIWGGNLLRVLSEVEKTASAIAKEAK